MKTLAKLVLFFSLVYFCNVSAQTQSYYYVYYSDIDFNIDWYFNEQSSLSYYEPGFYGYNYGMTQNWINGTNPPLYENRYFRTFYQFDLTVIPDDAYNIAVYLEAYRSSGSGDSKIVTVPDGQNYNDLQSTFEAIGSGSLYFDTDETPGTKHNLTSAVLPRLNQGYINIGAKEEGWHPFDHGYINARWHVYYDLPINIIADNNFTAPDGVTHGIINVDDSPTNDIAPYPFSRGENVNVKLKALEQPDIEGYVRNWNTGGSGFPNFPSKWERWRSGNPVPDDRGSLNPLNFTTTTDDDDALYKANLRKLYQVTVDYKTEGGTIPNGWNTEIFEQNSGNIWARPNLPGTNYNFVCWEDNPTAPNPRTITPTDNETYTAIYKATQLSNDQNAYKFNNQRKFIRTPNGTLHSVYQSMNAVWYEISTDNGQTWQIKDYSIPTEPTWIESEPSISYYVNSSNQTIVIIAWRLQRGSLEDLIKMKVYVYDPVYGLIETDEQDIYEENPEMLTVEKTSPVVTCAPNGKTLIIWENKINGVQSSFKYSYGERLSNGTWQWWQTNQWLECTSSGALSPALYASNIDYWLKFHLTWVQNNKIYYCCIYPNLDNELEYDSQNIEVSERSGYTTHSRPTITGTDYVSGSYRVEWLRLAWIGYRDAYIDDPCAVSAGESRVLYRYKTSSSWSSISALGSNANSVNINKGSTVINYWEPMACAWSEGNNCNYPNKYVRSHESVFIIRALNTTGDHLQLNNSTDFNNMYANSFHRNSSPFFFQVSNNLAGQIQKIEAIEIFKGREGVVTKDNVGFYYAIGDITVDGDVKDFSDFPDTISVNDLQTMNEYLLTKPFSVTNSSTLTYGVQYGITDSAAAVAALSDSSEITFRVELIDNQSGQILGFFDEVSYTSSNVFQYENIGYQVDLSGIGSRTVILKLVTATEADCDYSITNRYSDTETLNKNGYKQITFKGNSLITEYALEQNYPNPFNPTTTIKYQIPTSGNVSITVYDILGNEVANLVDGYLETGKYEVDFDASLLASGVYIYRLNVNDFINVKKMVLLR
jgi:hypothetical protein